ncbi:MAG: 23S rRNA (uridine2552-2'-O)-methyltransferase [Hyphomicrobiaceae bacterium]|jgi:23S rRNA (uridine2552-2'-O)-methyltransferase
MAQGPSKGAIGGGSGRSDRDKRVRVKSKAKRAISSRRWLERQLNDPYVAAAQKAGYRSRAAFKLIEINDKHPFLKTGQVIVDLGAAPGGWTQVLTDKVKSTDGRGQVVAIDILPMDEMAGAEVLHLDFMENDAPDRLKTLLRDGGADVVLSDMAGSTTGHARTDHLQIMGLAEAAVEFAVEVLKPGGVFVCKVFQGGTERDLLDILKRQFKIVRHVKPPASRKDSSELYVMATGFRGLKDEQASD